MALCTPEITDSLEHLLQKIRLGQIQCSYDLAYKTVDLLLQICSDQSWNTAEELINRLKMIGQKLISAQPSEMTVGNMVRRVLKIVREEYARAMLGNVMEDNAQASLQKMLLAEGDILQYGTIYPDLRESIIDAIGEVVTELENSLEAIATQALEHIHANEIIMTAGKSKTVEAFLKNAAKKRKFHVIVVECAPFYQGHEMAISLSSAGIETTLTTDSAVFALMSRVNKVLIGTYSVMANGGLKAVSGSHALALTAKHHSVPVIVCAAMHKLSPQYVCSYDQEAFNRFVSPQEVLPYCESIVPNVKVYNPVFDYVPPELVTLYISNVSGYAPSYVYRLIGELYHPDDLEL